MARRKTEADDFALALGSLSEENEPDARPRSKVQRLAVAGAIAPALRKGAEAAAKRRVILEAKDGSVAGYTNLLEVQKALIIDHGVEVEVQDGVKAKEVPCEWCGLGFVKKNCNSKVCDRCLGVGQASCAGGCGKKPCGKAFKSNEVLRRKKRPWACTKCANTKLFQDPEWLRKHALANAKRAAKQRKNYVNRSGEVEIATKMKEILEREYPAEAQTQKETES